MKTPILAAALGALLLSGAAAAQTPPPPRPDADRIVTRQDAAAEADRRFAEMDTNRDGKISSDERRAFHDARRAEREARRGHRGGKDREWTQAQFRERAMKRFDRIDTNHDGRIDAQEREAARMLMRARRVGHNGDGPMAPMPPAPADAKR
ncbi:ca2+ sensor protein [Sphingomonas adhaesiva]|uniref:ca2+ sensor protein n=1 Tax=Sphingomonas adhaesiva TaxID=28212 RepID=UPI002FFBA135